MHHSTAEFFYALQFLYVTPCWLSCFVLILPLQRPTERTYCQFFQLRVIIFYVLKIKATVWHFPLKTPASFLINLYTCFMYVRVNGYSCPWVYWVALTSKSWQIGLLSMIIDWDKLNIRQSVLSNWYMKNMILFCWFFIIRFWWIQ